MNPHDIAKNIEFQTKNDPRDKRHSITFLALNGTEKVFKNCIVISTFCNDNKNVLEWLDENDVHHLSYIPNFYDIFFDKDHRKMIEEIVEQKLKEQNG